MFRETGRSGRSGTESRSWTWSREGAEAEGMACVGGKVVDEGEA